VLFKGSIMALPEKKLKAIELRKKGWSYSMIKSEVQVSKSTLSLWLEGYPLSVERVRELRDHSQQRIEKFRQTMRRKREVRLRSVLNSEHRSIGTLSSKELYIVGLMLYWGEGGKTARSQITMSNTDPRMIRAFMYWSIHTLLVPKSSFRIKLHLYADMNLKEETEFWSNELDVPNTQFVRPYIKKSTLRGLTYKGLGHGTCNAIVYGRDYFERVMAGIEVIAQQLDGGLRSDGRILTGP
jgi:hypothetical protein